MLKNIRRAANRYRVGEIFNELASDLKDVLRDSR
jgi:hypothetical protein